jgi:RHS repeat-associated protein
MNHKKGTGSVSKSWLASEGLVRKRSQMRRLIVESLEDRRLFNVDWRNPVDSIDVDNDGFTSPLDALVVINYINENGSKSLATMRDPSKPYFDVDGDRSVSPLDVLSVINHLNTNGGSRSLAESSGQFVQETSVTITLGQTSGTREYRVRIDSQFDTTDKTAALEDLLAVYLVDPQKPTTTLLDRGQNGSSIFTLAGDKAEFVPGRVKWDGSVLEIDLSDIALSNTGLLKFQLLNSDIDSSTKITIQPLSNQVDIYGTNGPKLTLGGSQVTAGPSTNLANLTPIANGQMQVSNVRYDVSNGKYNAEVRFRNDGDPLGRDVAVVFPGLPAGVSLRSPSGTTTAGEPYINLKPAIQRGGLTNGLWTEPVAIEFNNPGHAPFVLKPKVLAAKNHAPTLAPIAPLTVMPGGVLNVSLNASDQDGDVITFSLNATSVTEPLPTGTFGSSGILTFRPSPSQLGTYQFDVTASDGALEATRSVTLNVVADPITTTRVSGKILQVNGQPIAGMPIQIGSVQGLTSADGSFTLDLGSGTVVSDTIKVRGELITGPKAYPYIAEKLAFILEHEVYANVNNVIDRPIYLPILDVAGGSQVDPTKDVAVRQQIALGETAEVFVASGTLTNQQGTPFNGTLSITEVPVAFTPASLPRGLSPDLVVTIQPGEMVFARPAPLSLPNRSGWGPGLVMDLWSINPVTGEFEDVGDAQVSADGKTVDTISGGVRNSSWHFVGGPPSPPRVDGPRNPKSGCGACPNSEGFNSDIELHSGTVIETHQLVTYQSQGVSRGVNLVFDSLRADPRPIVHFGFEDLDTNDFFPFGEERKKLRLVASMFVERGSFEMVVPGRPYDAANPYANVLGGDEHYWRLPEGRGAVDAALQVDFRNQPSGVYFYSVDSGIYYFTDGRTPGSSGRSRGRLAVVNSINSPFGAGWGIAGLQFLVEDENRSVMLVDGDGSELLFGYDPLKGTLVSPAGDFSELVKNSDGTFQRTLPDKTVYRFNASRNLESVTDRNNNVTRYTYDAQSRPTGVVDPTGLITTFTYSGNRVTEIVDPAGRITRLNHDISGNLIRVTDPDSSTRNWRYDAARHMVGETDQLGRQESSTYGFHGRAISAVRKDGSQISVQSPATEGLYPPEATMDYENAPMTFSLPKQAESVFVDGKGNVTRTLLDAAGQAIRKTDTMGVLPSVERDGNNLAITRRNARGDVISNTFDERGNHIASRDNLSVRLGDDPSKIGLMFGDFKRWGEKDYYSFVGKAGELFLIDKIRPNNDYSFDLKIYTPSGKLLQEDAFLFPEDGTYQVQIAPGSDLDEYAVAIRSMSNAPFIKWGNPTSPSTQAGEDVVYRFTAQRNQRLVFQHSVATESERWTVLGPNGSWVQRLYELTSDDQFEILFQENGEYYLYYKVRPSETHDPLALQFTAHLIDTVPIVKSGYNTTHTGTLQPDESREFSFSGSQGAYVYFNVLNEYSEISLELRGPQDQLLMENYTLESVRNYVYQLPDSGAFKMILRGPIDKSATYQFRINDLASATQAQFDSVIQGTLARNESAVYRLNGTAGQRFLLQSDSNTSVRLISSVTYHQKDYLPNGILTLPDTGEYFLIINKSNGPGAFSFSSVDLKRIPLVDISKDIKGTLSTGNERQYYRFKATPNNGIFLQNLGISFIITAEVLGEGGPLFDGYYSGLYNRFFVLGSANGIEQFDEFVFVVKHATDDASSSSEFGFRLHEQFESNEQIAIGQSVSGRLDLSEVDTYTFHGEKGTALYLDWRTVPGQATTGSSWVLIGPDNNGVGGTIGGGFENDPEPFSLPTTGTYRLRLSNLHSASSTNYAFRLFDVASAPFVSVNSPLSRELPRGSAANWFHFTAAAGQRIRFEQTSTNTQIKVYAPSGKLVLNTGTNAVQHIGISETGPHRILVTGRDPNVATPIMYDWLISLANDTPVTPSGFDTLYQGTARDGDVVATFSGNAGQQILFRQTWGYDPYRKDSVEIVGPLGDVIARSQISGDFSIVLPDSGQYTARVVGRNSPFTGTVPYAFILAKYTSITQMNPGTIYSVPALNSLGFFAPFTFEATAGQEITIDMIWPDSFDGSMPNSPVSLYIESPDGSSLSSITGLGSSPFVVNQSGTHLIRVAVHNGQALAIRLVNVNAAPKLPRETLFTGTNSFKYEDVIRRFDAAAGERLLLRAESGNWSVSRYSDTKGYAENIEVTWNAVETGPNTFLWEGLVEFSEAGTYTLIRSGSSQSPLEYSMVMTTPPVEPVFALTGGSLSQTKYSYDPIFNQPSSQTDQQGRRTDFDIDPTNGNIRSVTNIVGLLGGNDDLTTSFTHLASGQVDTIADPIGRILDFDYDSRGRLTSKKTAKGTSFETVSRYEYDAAGNTTAMVDENGNRSVYQYDSMNRVTRVTLPDPDGNGPLAPPIQQLSYDAAGNLRRITDALGNITEWTYDSLNRIISKKDSGGSTTKYAYDQAGNIIRVTDPLGNATRMLYDARNRMTISIDAAGFATQFGYDADDNVIALTDAAGNTTNFSYDARNRLVSKVDPLGSVTTYSYNGVDEIVAKVDRLGRSTRFEYDDLGRLVNEHWLDKQNVIVNTVNYVYDTANRLTNIQDDVSDYQVTYDVLDRPTREQTSGSNGIPTTILDRSYDANGNLLSTTDTINGLLGGTNAYSYDALDRLTRLVQSRAVGSTSPISDKRVDIAYNAIGQFASLLRFSDVAGLQSVAATSFSYDTLNRLTNISHRNPVNALLNSHAFAYDAASRITRITDIDGATNYSYDQRDQLTAANHADPNKPDETYSYDATGNRTSSHRHGTGYIVGDGLAGTNDNNRQTSDGTYTYAYDSEGNLVTRIQIVGGAVREFSWDHRNRLTRVTDRPSSAGAPTQVVEYSYDSMNRRIASKVDKTPGDPVDGTILYFVYEGRDVLADLTDPDGNGPASPTISKRYLHGPAVDQVMAQEYANGDVHWILADHLGSVRDLVNASGELVNHIKYDSFGNVIAESNPAIKSRYKYTGREFDAETGMQFNRARYYDANIGRFLSEDPIGFEGGSLNLVSYVANSPSNYRDPSGNNLVAAVGAGLGYDAGLLANVAGQMLGGTSLADIDVEQAFIAAGVGAVSGALATNKGFSVAGSYMLAGGSNLLQYVLTTKYCDQNWKNALFSLGTGIVGGWIGGTVSRAVPLPTRTRWSPPELNPTGGKVPYSQDTMRQMRTNRTLNDQAMGATVSNVGRAFGGAGAGSIPSPFEAGGGGQCGCE